MGLFLKFYISPPPNVRQRVDRTELNEMKPAVLDLDQTPGRWMRALDPVDADGGEQGERAEQRGHDHADREGHAYETGHVGCSRSPADGGRSSLTRIPIFRPVAHSPVGRTDIAPGSSAVHLPCGIASRVSADNYKYKYRQALRERSAAFALQFAATMVRARLPGIPAMVIVDTVLQRSAQSGLCVPVHTGVAVADV
jgi:hypothetical protein